MITSSILGLFMLVSCLYSFSYSSRRLFCSISVAFYSLFFFSNLCFIFGFQLFLLFAIILSLNDNEVISYSNVFRIIWKAQIYSDIDYFCFSSFYYNFIRYMNDERTFVLAWRWKMLVVNDCLQCFCWTKTKTDKNFFIEN